MKATIGHTNTQMDPNGHTNTQMETQMDIQIDPNRHLKGPKWTHKCPN